MNAARFVALMLLLTPAVSALPVGAEPRGPAVAADGIDVAGDGQAYAPAPLEAVDPVPVPVESPVPDLASASVAPPGLGGAGLRLGGALAVVGVLLALTLVVIRRLVRRPGRSPLSGVSRPRPAGRMSWLTRWVPASGPAADGLELVDRTYVGVKESVCIVRAGAERFLIGVTANRISLLGRLDSPHDRAAGRAPAGAEFARLDAPVAPDPARVDAFGAPDRSRVDEPVALDFSPVDEPGGTAFAVGLGGGVARAAAPADGSFRELLERSRQRVARLSASADRDEGQGA